MKCSKCGYLGFERVDRCRNCGYEFSLAAARNTPDLSIRSASADIDPLADIELVDGAVPPAPMPPAPTPELPLFRVPLGVDEPQVAKTSAPRPPLAVRRPTPDAPRRRMDEPRAQSLELDLDPPAPRARDAALFARLVAAIVDVAILVVIDAVVIYFTLEICGITIDDLAVLPKGPLLAFLLVQNGGYLIAFTAGGQTLGKMLTGVRVVEASSESPLDLGRAALRTALWVLLAIPAGLGFATALFSSDRRGLHDRFARTRVVRA